MSCQITTACIGCYNCLEVCPRGAIVEEAGLFAIRVKRCNECRENKPGPRCQLICPVEGAICKVVKLCKVEK